MRSLVLLLCMGWLAGCALRPAAPVTGQADRDHEASLARLHTWSVDGKLAIRAPGNSQTARLQWAQDGAAYDIHLSGPAGLKATRIQGQPGRVRFEQGSRQESAGSAEALAQRLLGWPLPAGGLVYWLRGLPDPGLPVARAEYGEGGMLLALSQAGWEIRFSGYAPVNGIYLPGQLEARHGDYRVTLVVKRWVLP